MRFESFSSSRLSGIEIRILFLWIVILYLRFSSACILLIKIQILELGDSDPSIGYWISGFLSEAFALGSKYIFETFNSFISKHIKSVLVSSKSMRDQPWFNNLPLFDDDKTLNQKNTFWFHMNIKLPINICIIIFRFSLYFP